MPPKPATKKPVPKGNAKASVKTGSAPPRYKIDDVMRKLNAMATSGTKKAVPKASVLKEGNPTPRPTVGFPRSLGIAHQGGGGRRGNMHLGGDPLMSEVVQEDAGAAVYAAALMDNLDGRYDGVRVPDLISYPTSTTAFYEERIYAVESNYAIRISVQPCVRNETTITAAAWWVENATASNATYGAGTGTPLAQQALANANFLLQRPVCQTMDVSIVSELVGAGGVYRVGRWTQRSDLPTTYDAGSANPYMESMPLVTSDGPALMRGNWLPSDYDTGLDLVAPTSASGYGGSFVEILNTTAATIFVMVRVRTNLEFLAKASVEPLFERAVVPGDGGAVGRAISWIGDMAGDFARSLLPSITSELSNVASELVDSFLDPWKGYFAGPQEYTGTPRTGGTYRGTKDRPVRREKMVAPVRQPARVVGPMEVHDFKRLLLSNRCRRVSDEEKARMLREHDDAVAGRDPAVVAAHVSSTGVSTMITAQNKRNLSLHSSPTWARAAAKATQAKPQPASAGVPAPVPRSPDGELAEWEEAYQRHRWPPRRA